MMPDYFYNNNYQIVQTPDTIMIMVEMIHDVRVIRVNGQHEPSSIKRWLGDSIGHWDGDTLVIDTSNFRADNAFRGASENLHVIERLRRIDAGTILYRATIDDPSTWTKPWTMEYPFLETKGPVYEYACQEGNYAIIVAGFVSVYTLASLVSLRQTVLGLAVAVVAGFLSALPGTGGASENTVPQQGPPLFSPAPPWVTP